MNFLSLPIIEIALSLIISWALFAIFCSLLQETAVQLKNERGRFFKQQLLRQLNDAPNQINWASLLYTHPSFDILSRAYNKPPSEISAKIFSEALVEVVANAHKVQSKKLDTELMSTLPVGTYENALLNDFALATKVLMPSELLALLSSSLNKAEIRAGSSKDRSDEKVYNFLIEEISDWFNQLSNRTSSWYRKLTKRRLFFLGLILSVALNINSITLFQYFSQNPAARTALIAYYEKNKDQLEAIAKKYDQSTGPHDSITLNTIKTDVLVLKTNIDSLAVANEIPIGWQHSVKKEPMKCHTIGDYFNRFLNFIIYLLGFMLTAFAASAGAPFWFELLKKAYTLKK
ncbi:MAG: hypothetical protein PSX81_06645 [bacterium]|nr:hypothetical protein [bacterium]